MTMLKKDINHYLNLPWTYSLEESLNALGQPLIFVIRVNKMPNICTDGRTKEEAREIIKELWLCRLRWILPIMYK